MLATLGDLVEDVVVSQLERRSMASDTAATIVRRRGGSAANVAAAAAALAAPCRFIGQVGDDDIGRALTAGLERDGVDTAHVRFGGETGTIVVILDEAGERTMFTDRGACVALDAPQRRWLEGVDTLHVPMYSLVAGEVADTAATAIEWAHELDVAVSIDASSESVIRAFGADAVRRLLVRLRPDVLLANNDESDALAIDGPVAGAVTIVKRGAHDAIVHSPHGPPVEVPALRLGAVADTTGAGDAFAAGFLTYESGWRRDAVAAVRAGHASAAARLAALSERTGTESAATYPARDGRAPT